MSVARAVPLSLDRRRLPAVPQGGAVSPPEAWRLVAAGQALLVDVRSAAERRFVGRVAHSLHVAWAEGPDLDRNPDFLDQLAARVGRDQALLLICRSGRRSALAVQAAVEAGFGPVASVREGFEGDIDTSGQRGHHNGWRFHGLAWVQD